MSNIDVSRDPPDIEVASACTENWIVMCSERDVPMSSAAPTAVSGLKSLNHSPQSLLALNPRVHPHASLVATSKTKAAKRHWKRNKDKDCSVSLIRANYYLPTTFNIYPPSLPPLSPSLSPSLPLFLSPSLLLPSSFSPPSLPPFFPPGLC